MDSNGSWPVRSSWLVQSSFAQEQQGEISGLSRSVSNLGSSLGTAIAGTILVAGLTAHAYVAAMVTLGVIGLIGLVAAMFLPARLAPVACPVGGMSRTFVAFSLGHE